MQHYTRLAVWRDAHQLALGVYRVTLRLPPRERYGLAAQLRRAAVSIPTNIAEGAKRLSDREFARFLNVAEGSAAEVEYLTSLCRDLGLLIGEDVNQLLADSAAVQRRLCSLRRRLCRP